MQSKANTGYKATFSVGDSASPTDYTQMAELASIKPSNFSIPAIDTTHLQSPNATEEMIPGLIKPGTIALSGNFTGDTSQLNISQLAQTQSVFPWKITSPINKGTQVYTAIGFRLHRQIRDRAVRTEQEDRLRRRHSDHRQHHGDGRLSPW
jgi:hypothetical protein